MSKKSLKSELRKNQTKYKKELDKLNHISQIETPLKSIDSDGFGLDRAGQALG